MRPLEEAGRPYTAIGMDEALAGLDDQPVTTGVRTSGQRVERAKELGGQMHGGRRHEESTSSVRIGYIRRRQPVNVHGWIRLLPWRVAAPHRDRQPMCSLSLGRAFW